MQNETLVTIANRRSIRRYRQELIRREELDAILLAGRQAPSGGNNQSSHFTAILNRDALDRLIALVETAFREMEVTPDTYKSLQNSIRLSQKGGYDFTMGAPILVVASNDRGYGNAMADCATALQNMMLAAASIGVGSCWVNQLRWLDESPLVREYLATLGIPQDEVICGSVALGYPASPAPPKAPKLTGNRITIIE